MEQNTLPPLVSDDDALTMARKEASNWRVGNQSDAVAGAEETILAVRAIYEQARKSDREVIQALVDDIRRLRMEFGNRVGCTTQIGNASLALAKSQCNIEPKTEHP